MRTFLECAFESKSVGASSDKSFAAFSGIASTSDTDLHNDIIEAGAFDPIRRKTLPSGDVVPDVLMLRDHDRTQVIGGWRRFEQLGHELHVEGELCLDVEKARETHALLKRGFLSGLSVGFEPGKNGVIWDQRSNKRVIKRATLRECSIVSMPANERARVLNVKQRAKIDEWLTERGLSADDIALLERAGFEALLDERLKEKTPEKPYGDVRYADPGYQEDGKKRYPVDTEDHIRAAWSYINQSKNREPYTDDQLSKIEGRIVAAWKRVIDEDGPPSAEKHKQLIHGIDGHSPIELATVQQALGDLLSKVRGRGHV